MTNIYIFFPSSHLYDNFRNYLQRKPQVLSNRSGHAMKQNIVTKNKENSKNNIYSVFSPFFFLNYLYT